MLITKKELEAILKEMDDKNRREALFAQEEESMYEEGEESSENNKVLYA